MNDMNIYLVGYMGSGKSEIGSALADMLGFTHVDIDTIIERHQGSSVSEIFDRESERYFRELESKILRDYNFTKKQVISTGGGLPCHSGNIDCMNETGITVYLKTSTSVLTHRLQSDTSRPLLKNKRDDELSRFIENHLKERIHFYEKAQYVVDGSQDPGPIIDLIFHYYRDCESNID